MADSTQKNKPGPGKWWKLAIKLLITACCIWYVSGKIDFALAGKTLTNANWFFLLLALVTLILSRLFWAIRLNTYFRNIRIPLGWAQNIRLYWLGMFYNSFLPGSIGGDAHKVMLITRKFNASYKKTMGAILLDRFTGLLGLGLILAVYGVIVFQNTQYEILLVGGILAGFLAFYLAIKRYLKDFHSNFFIALFYAILGQLLQVLSVYLIMASLGIPVHVSEYIFMFLISCVVTILPLTIGGLGAREIIFLEGSIYFGLPREVSIVISLLFYLLMVLASVWGLIYVFQDPLKIKKDP